MPLPVSKLRCDAIDNRGKRPFITIRLGTIFGKIDYLAGQQSGSMTFCSDLHHKVEILRRQGKNAHLGHALTLTNNLSM
jgi:hypothetical protein